MKYKHSKAEGWFIQIDETGNKTEFTEKNRPGLYREMMQWVDEGNQIEPAITAEEQAIIDTEAFERTKASKPSDLKAACENELAKGLTVLVGSASFPDGFKIDSTRNDATFLSAVYNDANLNNLTEIYFRDFDNVSRLITYNEFLTLLQELSIHINTQLAKKWALQDSIAGCKTIEEIQAITWD